MAHCVEMWWLMVRDGMAHCVEMWWLNGGDGMAQCVEMWWPNGGDGKAGRQYLGEPVEQRWLIGAEM